MKQTAVEWLRKELLKRDMDMSIRELFEQAKEMEKQQHGKTWDSTIEQGEKRAWNISRLYTDFDDYYNDTYGSKGSDEHIEHNLDEIVTSSQTEISDEEIEKAAKEYVLYNDQKRTWVIEGMKLYREQYYNQTFKQ